MKGSPKYLRILAAASLELSEGRLEKSLLVYHYLYETLDLFTSSLPDFSIGG